MANGERTEGLEEAYKYVYTCSECDLRYGSDKEEKGLHFCPICEKKE